MNFLALRMLIGDRAKYLGLIFSIAFASFLISQHGVVFYRLDEADHQLRPEQPNHAAQETSFEAAIRESLERKLGA
jgi:hypothetical protein